MDIERPSYNNMEKRDSIMEKYNVNYKKTSLRKLHLVIDFSKNTLDKDFQPNIIYMVLSKAIDFVQEFFELNPLSNIALSILKDKKCILLANLKNNPAEIVSVLENLRKKNSLSEDNLFEEFNKDPDAGTAADVPSGNTILLRRDIDGECFEGNLGAHV